MYPLGDIVIKSLVSMYNFFDFLICAYFVLDLHVFFTLTNLHFDIFQKKLKILFLNKYCLKQNL